MPSAPGKEFSCRQPDNTRVRPVRRNLYGLFYLCYFFIYNVQAERMRSSTNLYSNNPLPFYNLNGYRWRTFLFRAGKNK
jgi:hypothetical protein